MSEFENEVLRFLKQIDEKLNKLLDKKNSKEEIAISATEKVDSYVKPSLVVEKQQEEERAKEKPLVEGRRVCPACGGTSFNTEEDKSQVFP